MATGYEFWKAALKGKRIDEGGRGAQAGFYRHKHSKPLPDGSHWEPVAFWPVKHPETGEMVMRWQRNAPGVREKDWTKIFPDQVDDLWARCSLYPIPEQLYREVRAGAPWPEIYTVEPPLDFMRQGKIMTPEEAAEILEVRSGRKRIKEKAAEIAAASEPAAADEGDGQIGHNSQAAADDKRTGAEKYDELIADEWRNFQRWLTSIGKVISTQEHADKANAYKEKFRAMRIEADKLREKEKAPHLQAGKKVDAAWTPLKTKCDGYFDQVVGYQAAFLKKLRDAEQKRQQDEAAKRAAEAAANPSPIAEPERRPAPAPAPAPRAGNAGRATELKQVPVVVILDHEAVYKAYEKSQEFLASAVAWASTKGLPPNEKIPGTTIEYRDEVKG